MPRYRRCRQMGCHTMVQYPNHYCEVHFEHEAEYLASRQKWNAKQNKQYTHKYNTVTRNRNETKREQYNFYRTRQWSHLRQIVLNRDLYMCQYCKAIGKISPDSKTVDHIVPVEAQPSSRADIDNLAVICRQCHHIKTDWERQYYGTGQENALKNVERIKDINRVVLMMNGGN